jgi:transcriptional regulator with XRE-family HTH domain
MSIGDKIKGLRTGKGMSQAELAEKLNVSRQAVTKWENDNGTPEVESLIAIADLFEISVDALVKDGAPVFSSAIQYDIETAKDFEFELTPCRSVTLEGHDSEKVRIEMTSDTIADLDSDLKASIDDSRRNMNVKIRRKNDLTDSDCRENLTVRILLPRKYIGRIELETDVSDLHLRSFSTKDIEFGGSANTITLKDVHGQAEMDVRSDCTFLVYDLDGSLEINQVDRSSVVKIPKDVGFRPVNAGRKCDLDVSKKLSSSDKSEDIIELNGMKSSLRIEALK